MIRFLDFPASTPRAKYEPRYEVIFAGRLATGDNPLPASNARRMLKAKKHKHLTLDNKRVSVNMGNNRRVLPVGHSPSPIVAHRAHAARGNGYKAKAEKKPTERKPAAPFTTPYIALKADNIEKSAAK
ncbi:hypothetical protein [Methylobacter tundripaludum]|uniref:Uncharacterized protein n=1 Tax=Methylobacter tundripaludum (strain ATCC BAA-1195 / DSM 17260 / SV96) TaxID=697282 RepID=G3J0E3_METTV|nr:hypothetical protein [Methylobacter tundripaludum]EGW20665.1 hypothetical protein Mettu_3814 [Methylobacter tundripaludum SV96]